MYDALLIVILDLKIPIKLCVVSCSFVWDLFFSIELNGDVAKYLVQCKIENFGKTPKLERLFWPQYSDVTGKVMTGFCDEKVTSVSNYSCALVGYTYYFGQKTGDGC
jgi:hypothetical protein